jgi:MoaA/NifB/PqqE/SkfB family radical SAM enzyme
MNLTNQEQQKRNKLALEKPLVYQKMLSFDDKLRKGEAVPIIQLQYNYICNFKCQHCSIKSLQYKPVGKRKLTPHDIENLSRQADELGLARFVITGGEPLLFKDFDELVEAINPEKFYINCDTNGWYLDDIRAKHLKSIGVDRIQLSIDNLNEKEHDEFRRAPGSFQRTLKAIDASRNANLDIFVQTVVTKQRLHSEEFIEFLKYLNSRDITVYVGYARPVGAFEGHFEAMVDENDIQYMKELEKKYDVCTHLTPAYGRELGCIAVKGMISITQYGDVLPCQSMFISIGNILETPLKDIIDKGMKIKYFGEWVGICTMASDKAFIDKYIVPYYGEKHLPIPSDKVFTDDDKTITSFNQYMLDNGKFK